MLYKFLTCSVSYGLWPHVAGLNEQNKIYYTILWDVE